MYTKECKQASCKLVNMKLQSWICEYIQSATMAKQMQSLTINAVEPIPELPIPHNPHQPATTHVFSSLHLHSLFTSP